jgi:hypothetical protein
MSLSFTAQQRKDITRRQLNIALENAGYSATAASMTANQAKLQNVDNANDVFYAFFDTQVRSYEGEAQAVNGTESAEYSSTDITTAAQSPGSAGCIFFPPTSYSFLIPEIVDQVNGYLHPTGTAASYETIAMSDPSSYSGVADLITLLQSGITGSGGSTSTVTGPHSSDPLNFDVSSITGFTVGELVYVTDNTNSGVYKVSALTPASSDPAYITVTDVYPAATKPGVGATVKDTVVGFTNTERQNLTSTDYQEILSSETSALATAVTAWQTALNSQVANLTSQNDSRATQSSQNATALANANAALTVVNAWLALSPTGSSGRYVDSSLSPLSSEVTTRNSFLPTRATQIVAALGSVVDNGDGTFSDGGSSSSYYNRYWWLNVRVNRLTGSLTRYYAAGSAVSYNNTLAAANTSLQSQYNSYFLTSQLSVVDGTSEVTCSSTTGFSNGDSVTVVSESQPELTGTVVSVLGPQQLSLSFSVPVTYQTNQTDLARIFKQL